MKKVFAFLMVLTLLAPMGLVANAADPVAAKPFYGVGWSDLNQDKFPYVDGLVTMNIGVGGGGITLSYSGAKITSGKIDEAQLDKMVQALKAKMDSRPQGERYIHFAGPAKALDASPQNVIYLDYGVDRLKELTTALFEKYKEAGGLVDGAVMSTLYTGMGSYYINTTDAKKDPLIYNKIVQDPRYATEVRPLLEERGFKFYDNPSEYTPEIYGITGNAGSAYSACASIWDTVMRNRLNNYMTEWCYEPMARYFPDVHCSDYQCTDNDTWLKGVNSDGSRIGAGGNTLRAGNTSCQNFYSDRPSNNFFNSSGQPVYKNIPTYHEAIYQNTPFNCFLYDTNEAKKVYLSTDDGNVCYWVNRYDGSPEDTSAITNTPYYSELVLHLNLLDPKPFVIFLYRNSFDNQEDFDRCTSVVNELLTELTRVAGYADRKPIALPQNWNSEFVLSGMYANGRNIWRITPNLDEISKVDFKVEGSDPTFRVKGQTITFPGGKIIEDAAISQIGTCGYWVETAADVTPIVTNDADRFDKFPAYSEDFESYAPDTKLVTMNIRDKGAWIIQPKGSDLVVTAQGKNQVLAITGNSLMQNKLIPQNVTAADSYAKDQSWQITVTIPEGMGGELILLNYEANKTPCKDGGFKIADGKVYYATVGTNEEGKAVQEYKELRDIAPGTYTFQRVLNLHDGENYICDYILTDAAGASTQAKNVAIPTFTGTVTSIGITCKKVTGTVLLDDYILKLTGAAADLELYEAVFGMPLTGEIPQATDTAYHLSWMNATAQEETATVVAAIYHGNTLLAEKIIKKVKMAPGYDGVETGVVELSEGQTVKVYLKTTVNSESDDQNQGNDDAKKGGISTVFGIIIAVVVVVLIAFLLLPNPKQRIPRAPTTRL